MSSFYGCCPTRKIFEFQWAFSKAFNIAKFDNAFGSHIKSSVNRLRKTTVEYQCHHVYCISLTLFTIIFKTGRANVYWGIVKLYAFSRKMCVYFEIRKKTFLYISLCSSLAATQSVKTRRNINFIDNYNLHILPKYIIGLLRWYMYFVKWFLFTVYTSSPTKDWIIQCQIRYNSDSFFAGLSWDLFSCSFSNYFYNIIFSSTFTSEAMLVTGWDISLNKLFLWNVTDIVFSLISYISSILYNFFHPKAAIKLQ